MMPPSTSQIAPVTHELLSSESRKINHRQQLSSGLANAATIGWKGSNWFIHFFRNFFRRHNFLINIGFDHPDRDRIDADMVAGRSSIAICCVRECSPAFCSWNRLEEGVASTARLAHIEPTFTIDPAPLSFIRPWANSLGDKEKASIQIEISIVDPPCCDPKGSRA